MHTPQWFLLSDQYRCELEASKAIRKIFYSQDQKRKGLQGFNFRTNNTTRQFVFLLVQTKSNAMQKKVVSTMVIWLWVTKPPDRFKNAHEKQTTCRKRPTNWSFVSLYRVFFSSTNTNIHITRKVFNRILIGMVHCKEEVCRYKIGKSDEKSFLSAET